MSSQPETPKASLEQALGMARSLAPLDKVRLIESLAPDLETALAPASPMPVRKRSLFGILRGCSISPTDIDEARQEMWGGFPRDDERCRAL